MEESLQEPVMALITQQVQALLSAMARYPTVRLRVLLAVTTGLRRSALEAIRIGDMHFDRNTLTTQNRKAGKATECNGTFKKGAEDLMWIWARGSADVNDGKWHHVVGTHEGAQMCAYVDERLVDFESRGGNAVTYNDPIYLGGRIRKTSGTA
jgi:hypothetical protein